MQIKYAIVHPFMRIQWHTYLAYFKVKKAEFIAAVGRNGNKTHLRHVPIHFVENESLVVVSDGQFHLCAVLPDALDAVGFYQSLGQFDNLLFQRIVAGHIPVVSV